LELSQSPLLPPRLEDEYFKGALRMMSMYHNFVPSSNFLQTPKSLAKPDSPHHQAVLSSLFNQPPRPVRGFLYDLEAELPEHAALNNTVHARLAAIFRLHGAVDMEPPLLMPVTAVEDEQKQATFIDRHGDIVALPNDLLLPFSRLAARGSVKRIKRFQHFQYLSTEAWVLFDYLE
jgi:translation initiation factor 2-alpha kinase 4